MPNTIKFFFNYWKKNKKKEITSSVVKEGKCPQEAFCDCLSSMSMGIALTLFTGHLLNLLEVTKIYSN